MLTTPSAETTEGPGNLSIAGVLSFQSFDRIHTAPYPPPVARSERALDAIMRAGLHKAGRKLMEVKRELKRLRKAGSAEA